MMTYIFILKEICHFNLLNDVDIDGMCQSSIEHNNGCIQIIVFIAIVPLLWCFWFSVNQEQP